MLVLKRKRNVSALRFKEFLNSILYLRTNNEIPKIKIFHKSDFIPINTLMGALHKCLSHFYEIIVPPQ